MVESRVWVPLISGGLLASLGLARRSRAGYALAAFGAAMLIGGAPLLAVERLLRRRKPAVG